jgi:hypothetical protein
MCQGHTFMWSAVYASIHINSPYNRPIISSSTIHHSLLLIPWMSKDASSALLQVLSNHWAQIHSLISNDLVNQVLPMFSIKCFPLSPTSYPKISTRRVPMWPECQSPWLLPSVCTYPVYMTLLCCEVSLMHWPLHIMSLVCAHKSIHQDWCQRHEECDRHVICHSTTLTCSKTVIPRSCDSPS